MASEREALEEILTYCLDQYEFEKRCWEGEQDHWARRSMRIYAPIIRMCTKALGKKIHLLYM